MALDDAARADALRRMNENVALEHAALVQYLLDVYRLKPEGLEEEIETIAREEMYHLWGFAQLVLELGGSPRLDRGAVYADGRDLTQILLVNVASEDGAIKKYTADLEAIDDEYIRDYLRRVIRDEQHHRLRFRTMLAARPDAPPDIEAEAAKAIPIGEGTPAPHVAEEDVVIPVAANDRSVGGTLARAVYTQYQLVLNLLQRYFDAWGTPEAEELLRSTIRAMKNLGDLSETWGDTGATVHLARVTPPGAYQDPAATMSLLRAAQDRVEEVIAANQQEGTGDAVLADLLRRMAADQQRIAERFPELVRARRAEEDRAPEGEATPTSAEVLQLPRLRNLFGQPQ